jgi:hypothetical protein
LDSGYEPLFLLDSKEGKLMVRDSRKKNAHRERYVTVANGFFVVFADETKERTLKVISLDGLEVMKHKKVQLQCLPRLVPACSSSCVLSLTHTRTFVRTRTRTHSRTARSCGCTATRRARGTS